MAQEAMAAAAEVVGAGMGGKLLAMRKIVGTGSTLAMTPNTMRSLETAGVGGEEAQGKLHLGAMKGLVDALGRGEQERPATGTHDHALR